MASAHSRHATGIKRSQGAASPRPAVTTHPEGRRGSRSAEDPAGATHRRTSRPLGSASTSSDGSDFGYDIKAEIEVDRALQKANRSRKRKKQAAFCSRAAKADGEADARLAAEAEALMKAQRWRPKRGRLPEEMSARVAAQQRIANPLIEMLGIKLRITASASDDDSEDPKSDGSMTETSDDYAYGDPPKLKRRNLGSRGRKMRLNARDMTGAFGSSPSKAASIHHGSSRVEEDSETEASGAGNTKAIHAAASKGKDHAPDRGAFVECTDGVSKEPQTVVSSDTDEEEMDEAELRIRWEREREEKLRKAKGAQSQRAAPPGVPHHEQAAPAGDDDEMTEDESQALDFSALLPFSADPSQSAPVSRSVASYPRTQAEAKPHFKLNDAPQASTGPLVLRPPGRKMVLGRVVQTGRVATRMESEDRAVEVPQGINRFLRPYQREGIQFFWLHYAKGEGAILGDDMGLGKTIQVLGFLSAVMHATGTEKDKNRRKKLVDNSVSKKTPEGRRVAATDYGATCIIVCPTSVIDNWLREIETWTYLAATPITSKTRKTVLQQFRDGRWDIVVAGLEFTRDHIEDLYDQDFSVLIIDEVHRIKNRLSRSAKAMDQFQTRMRYGLTGTALQNEYGELHTILNWARPGELGTAVMWDAFVTRPLIVAQKADAAPVEIALGRARARALRDRCLPCFFLRRTKDLIADQLPNKIDQVVFCPMTATQTYAYRNLLASPQVQDMLRNEEACECGSTDPAGLPFSRGRCCHQGWEKHILQFITIFTKVANHLVLVYPNKADSKEKYDQDRNLIQLAFPKDHGKRAYSMLAEFDEELCGKWKVLKALLRTWKRGGDKVLVFSRSRKLLDCLDHFCQKHFPNFLRLDGETAHAERLPLVDRFQNDPDIFCFLVSTLAGGVGLNLTASNKVVIFDPNWNPSHDLQALDRAFRIGQTRDVECFRLVSAGSLEELIYTRQMYKGQAAGTVYNADPTSRYFLGIQNDPSNKGELFGIKNLFRLQGDASLSKHIIERANVSEIAYALENMVRSKPAGKRKRGGAEDDVDDGAATYDTDAGTEALSTVFTSKRPLAACAAQSEKRYSLEDLLRDEGVDYMHNHGEVMAGSRVERHIASRALQDQHNKGTTKKKPRKRELSGRDEPEGGIWHPPARAKGKGKEANERQDAQRTRSPSGSEDEGSEVGSFLKQMVKAEGSREKAISKVAELAGYDSVAAFSRAFKTKDLSVLSQTIEGYLRLRREESRAQPRVVL